MLTLSGNVHHLTAMRETRGFVSAGANCMRARRADLGLNNLRYPPSYDTEPCIPTKRLGGN